MFYDNLETMMKHFSTTGAFLTTKNEDKANIMTISWGFIGFLWGKPHFITVVRPQRHTATMLKNTDSFTVSVPFGTLKDELKICGTQSGRDIDKSKVVCLVSGKETQTPIVAGCDAYYECKIRYVDDFKEELLPEAIQSSFYQGDYHQFLIGEIVASYGN